MKIVPISAFRDNYIWAVCSDTHCALVDPGQAEPAQAFLDRNGLTLAAILVTHRHSDHVGGIETLLARTPGTPVYGPADEDIPARTHALCDGAIVDLAELGRYTVLAVPGHTEGHIAYHGEHALFCGDTLFAAGCGRVLGGTASQLHASLQRLAALPADTRIYCAHEYTLSNLRFAQTVEPDNAAITLRQAACMALRERGEPTLPARLAEEWETNPFLRVHLPAVQARAADHAGSIPIDAPAVFAVLRSWKDHF
ncbi:MAG: hydroxyacylglutathione hydrolase [Rhodocyclaceae bacterium]